MKSKRSIQRRTGLAAPAPAPALPAPRGFGPAPGGVHPAVLRPSAGGSPLPAPVQAKMEQALGHNFANVRVHQGQEAPSIGALAFARGSHLHFAPGQYRPHSAAGQRILAHELAHVVQQREGRVAHPGGAVPINDDAHLEAQADAAAARAGQGGGAAPPAAPGRAAALPVGMGAVQMETDDEDDSASPAAPSPAAAAFSASAAGPGGPGKPALKETQFGGFLDSKLLFLPSDRVDAAPQGTTDRLKQLYKGSGYAQEKRGYGHQRTAQTLRWMSTVMHSHLSGMVGSVPEVQTSYSNGKFIISSNSDAHNERLRNQLTGKSVREAFRGILASGTPHGKAADPRFEPRFRRHAAKLNQRLVKSDPGEEYRTLRPGFDAPFQVPVPVGKKMDGLHAERRIKAHLNDAFRDATTRGTMRPCAVCNQECYGDACGGAVLSGSGDHPEHAGPLWTSKASTKGVTVDDEYKKKAGAGGTYASLTRNPDGDHIHFQYDTDSDSDAEQELAASVPAAGGGGRARKPRRARGAADAGPETSRAPRKKALRAEGGLAAKGKGPASDEDSGDDADDEE